MDVLVEHRAAARGQRIAHRAHQHGGVAHEHGHPAAPDGVELAVHVRGERGVHQVKRADVGVRPAVRRRAFLRLAHELWRDLEARHAAMLTDLGKQRIDGKPRPAAHLQDARTTRDPRRAPRVPHLVDPQRMLARQAIALLVMGAEDVFVRRPGAGGGHGVL